MAGYSTTEDPYQTPIGRLTESCDSVPPELRVRKVKRLAEARGPMAAMAVTDGDIPIGLVMSIHLDRILSHRYGVSLFENRAIRDIMDASPLIVEDDAALEEVADLAMRRDRRKIYDHVLITSKGRLTGMVSVQTLLLSLVESEKERTIELVTANRMLQEEIGERKSVEQQLVQ